VEDQAEARSPEVDNPPLPGRKRPGRRIARGLGALLIIAIAGGFLYLRAWPPLVVVASSSMEPAIDTGSVVLMRHTGGAPQVGDVVAVPVPPEAQATGYPDEVLHRVIEITEDGLVRTQGDNLAEPDPFAVHVSTVKASAVTVVPGAGKLLAFLFSPFGILWSAAGFFAFVVMPFFDGQRELRLAVSEYGYHLRSHTQILKSMSVASQDLAKVTDQLREAMPGVPPDGAQAEGEPAATEVESAAPPQDSTGPDDDTSSGLVDTDAAHPDTPEPEPGQFDEDHQHQPSAEALFPEWVNTAGPPHEPEARPPEAQTHQPLFPEWVNTAGPPHEPEASLPDVQWDEPLFPDWVSG